MPQRVLVWVSKHSLTENLLRLSLAADGIETAFYHEKSLSPGEIKSYTHLIIDDGINPSMEKWSAKLTKVKNLPRLIYLTKSSPAPRLRKPGLISWTPLAKPFNPQELRDMILNTKDEPTA